MTSPKVLDIVRALIHLTDSPMLRLQTDREWRNRSRGQRRHLYQVEFEVFRRARNPFPSSPQPQILLRIALPARHVPRRPDGVCYRNQGRCVLRLFRVLCNHDQRNEVRNKYNKNKMGRVRSLALRPDLKASFAQRRASRLRQPLQDADYHCRLQNRILHDLYQKPLLPPAWRDQLLYANPPLRDRHL